MTIHKFKIGQTVYLISFRNENAPGGTYVVIKRMPEHNGEYEYQVRSSYEQYQRVVRESQLRARHNSQPVEVVDSGEKR
jgi:hypothetical protein